MYSLDLGLSKSWADELEAVASAKTVGHPSVGHQIYNLCNTEIFLLVYIVRDEHYGHRYG